MSNGVRPPSDSKGFILRGMDELIDRLSGTLRQRTYEDHVRMRQGLVTAVPGNGTVTVKIGGDSMSRQGIPYIGTVPGVGDKIVLLQQGSKTYCLGVASLF